MERGTFYLLLPNKILYTSEFNGGMDPDQKGDKILKLLRLVENEKEFKDLAEKINNLYFGYDEELVYEEDKKIKGTVDVKEIGTSSDWNFVKNMTGEEITVILHSHSGKDIKVNLYNKTTMRYHYSGVPYKNDGGFKGMFKTLKELGNKDKTSLKEVIEIVSNTNLSED